MPFHTGSLAPDVNTATNTTTKYISARCEYTHVAISCTKLVLIALCALPVAAVEACAHCLSGEGQQAWESSADS